MKNKEIIKKVIGNILVFSIFLTMLLLVDADPLSVLLGSFYILALDYVNNEL